MQIITKLKPLLKLKSVRAVLVVLGVIILISIFSGDSTDGTVTADQQKPVVSLTSPTEYVGGQSISIIGNVRAFNEAAITSESAGRVTGVNVSLGQQVAAGTVLATLENASERASVLQAEGIYDAAVAAAAQSNLGVDEAQTSLKRAQDSAVSSFKSAYNTINGIIVNSIDPFFSDPEARVPGLRIDGRGFTSELNSERVAYQTLLSAWQTDVNTISPSSELEPELEYAKANVQRTMSLVDTFLVIFNKQDGSSRYSDSELLAFTNSFTILRTTLIGVQSNLDNAQSGLSSAADGVRRAELSAQGSVTSTADAQVKQALGALRSAQANLAKTILRTPVSGTVNSLSIRTGDFINSFSQVAIVANNKALEVITYISDNERELLNIGDEVAVGGAYPGTITHISPAVDSKTRKIEVRIATEGEGITNGDTVRITKDVVVDENITLIIRVPLTAVKFDRDNGSIFMVENGVLVSKAVTLGNILGGSVEVIDGLAANDEFVVDARGLIAGSEVEIKN